jgi:hypothetical protein
MSRVKNRNGFRVAAIVHDFDWPNNAKTPVRVRKTSRQEVSQEFSRGLCTKPPTIQTDPLPTIWAAILKRSGRGGIKRLRVETPWHVVNAIEFENLLKRYPGPWMLNRRCSSLRRFSRSSNARYAARLGFMGVICKRTFASEFPGCASLLFPQSTFRCSV